MTWNHPYLYQPSNILFADSEILKVCDLGIATKRSDEDDIDTDVSRSMAGTKLYMSPEQVCLLKRKTVNNSISIDSALWETLQLENGCFHAWTDFSGTSGSDEQFHAQ